MSEKEKTNDHGTPKEETNLSNNINKEEHQMEEDKFKGMSTKEAYFASLNAWVKHAYLSQSAMALFPWYLMSNYPQMFQHQSTGTTAGTSYVPPLQQPAVQPRQMPTEGANVNLNANINANRNGGLLQYRIMGEQEQTEFITRNGGYEFVVAPFWKRAGAEAIDVFILLLFKVVVIFAVMNLIDIDYNFDFDKDVIRKIIDDRDVSGVLGSTFDLVPYSVDLLILELLIKLSVCFYEAFWTSVSRGATPGKSILGIRILHAEAVYNIPLPAQQLQQLNLLPVQIVRQQSRVLIFPAKTPNMRRAFVRAIVKNLIVTLFFPMCFIMIFFKNNRTVYDVFTKTIVVEDNSNPLLRYPQQVQPQRQ